MAHPTRRPPSRMLLAAAAVALAMAAGPFVPVAPAQEAASVAAAAELTRLLDSAKLDAIAAVYPENPAAWVAALYFKDGQLLVVSAEYSAPVLLAEKMKVRDYRDIYLALFSSPVQGTKVFVMDSDANGLVARPRDDSGPDIWEKKDTTVAFDGEWRRAKMSEADYRKAFAEADEQYTKMLQVLAAQAKRPAGGTDERQP